MPSQGRKKATRKTMADAATTRSAVVSLLRSMQTPPFRASSDVSARGRARSGGGRVAVTPTASIAPMPSPQIAVLASGTGTLVQAIIEEALPVAVVVADRPCAALERAEAAGVATELVERTEWGPSFDRSDYAERLVKVLRAHGVDAVVMAGFGTIVPDLPTA